MRRATALLLFLSLIAMPDRADTQTAYAFEAGAVTAFDEAAIQLGVRVGPARGGIGSVDFAAATFPDAIAAGFFLFMLDLDATFGGALSGEQIVLFPRAGVSVIGGAGNGGGGGAVGYNLGLGVLGRVSPRLGLRLDYTHRRFLGGGASLPLSSITVGIVVLH